MYMNKRFSPVLKRSPLIEYRINFLKRSLIEANGFLIGEGLFCQIARAYQIAGCRVVNASLLVVMRYRGDMFGLVSVNTLNGFRQSAVQIGQFFVSDVSNQ